MDNNDAIEMAKQFSKTEMLVICEELGIAVEPSAKATEIIKAVASDLDENGVPETKDCSKLLREFLQTASYIDEKGELLKVAEDVQEQPTAKQFVDEADIPAEELPECFHLALADDRDPSCIRCKVRALCTTRRIERRPECYGLYFSPHAEECLACIEAVHCKIVTESNK